MLTPTVPFKTQSLFILISLRRQKCEDYKATQVTVRNFNEKLQSSNISSRISAVSGHRIPELHRKKPILEINSTKSLEEQT